MWGPLADRRYRRLFAAQVVALSGTGLTTVALALLAYDLAGERAGAVLGTALALKMVAYVAVAPVVGAFAHRLPRRALLVALDAARAGLVLALPFVAAAWQAYALIFLLNACSAAFAPVLQATVPEILKDEATYTRALSLSRLAYDLETLSSPVLAAAALLVIGYDVLFVGNALAFCLSAALIAGVALPRARLPERTGGLAATVGFGLRVYLRTPRLRALLALSTAVAAAGAMTIVNTVVVVRERFGGGEADVAVAFAAAGAGSMAVALALPRVLDRVDDRPVMLAGGGVLALGLAAGPAVAAPGWLLALWAVLGAGASMIQTPAGRLLRRSSGEGDRPAVYSAQFALSHLGWMATYPLAGWAGASLGTDAAFALMAALGVLATGAAIRLWPAHDPVEIDHAHAPMDHDHPHVHDAHHRHEHEGWEGPEPHRHPHRHRPLRHRHAFAVDLHHPTWPRG